jgi:hypothetical protein
VEIKSLDEAPRTCFNLPNSHERSTEFFRIVNNLGTRPRKGSPALTWIAEKGVSDTSRVKISCVWCLVASIAGGNVLTSAHMLHVHVGCVSSNSDPWLPGSNRWL